MYDGNGWHPIPYLDQGEFYSEFGDFDVRITVPKNYVVAATGALQDPKKKPGSPQKKTLSLLKLSPKYPGVQKETKIEIPGSSEMKTLFYKQDNVHDFAWFADKSFAVLHDTCALNDGKVIDVFSFYNPKDDVIWKNSVQYAKDAIRFYSNEVGAYPYQLSQLLKVPKSFGGGMEYPTITIISPVSNEKELDGVIAHELGHNWFYGILASNERDHPWMDEGINSFDEAKYMERKYGSYNVLFKFLYQTKAARKTDQPIETPAYDFSEVNYGLIAYYKTAGWMRALEKKFGEDAVRKSMQQHYASWKFKHPAPEDFESAIKQELAGDVQPLFDALHTKGLLPGDEVKGFKIVSPIIQISDF